MTPSGAGAPAGGTDAGAAGVRAASDGSAAPAGKRPLRPSPLAAPTAAAPSSAASRRRKTPKQALNAYNLFVLDRWPEVASRHPELGFTQMTAEMGREWKALRPEERRLYKQREAQEISRYFEAKDSLLPEQQRERRFKRRGAPKNPRSAYTFFISENRKRIQDANPGLNFSQVAVLAGQQWKSLQPEERAPYELRAQRDKQRFLAERHTWRAAQPPPSAEEKKRRRDRRRDHKGPKRPCTAFIYFSREAGASIRADHKKLSFSEVSRQVAREFRMLTPDNRARYDELARQDRERYKRELKELKDKLTQFETPAEGSAADLDRAMHADSKPLHSIGRAPPAEAQLDDHEQGTALALQGAEVAVAHSHSEHHHGLHLPHSLGQHTHNPHDHHHLLHLHHHHHHHHHHNHPDADEVSSNEGGNAEDDVEDNHLMHDEHDHHHHHHHHHHHDHDHHHHHQHQDVEDHHHFLDHGDQHHAGVHHPEDADANEGQPTPPPLHTEVGEVEVVDEVMEQVVEEVVEEEEVVVESDEASDIMEEEEEHDDEGRPEILEPPQLQPPEQRQQKGNAVPRRQLQRAQSVLQPRDSLHGHQRDAGRGDQGQPLSNVASEASLPPIGSCDDEPGSTTSSRVSQPPQDQPTSPEQQGFAADLPSPPQVIVD